MDTREFLSLVLPCEGIIFTATPRVAGKGWENRAHSSIESAISHVNALTFEHRAAYYAVSTFEKERVLDENTGKYQQRTQANAKLIKSIYLDLDVDRDNSGKFSSKKDAIVELKELIRKTKLPKPILVDSGGGIHAYWPLLEAVSPSVWKETTYKLKAICGHLKFRADPAPTCDEARVMRCVGSYNVRRNSSVSLLTREIPTDFKGYSLPLIDSLLEDFCRNSDIAGGSSFFVGKGLSIVNNAYPQNNLSRAEILHDFSKIAQRCNQIKELREIRGKNAGEQLWRGALGIVKFCGSEKEDYRSVSDGYDGYSEEDTVGKLNNWNGGPTTCTYFRDVNPTGCAGCAYKVTSPIALDHDRYATTETALSTQLVIVNGEEREITIPMPGPYYFLPEKGGVAIGTTRKDDEGNEISDVFVVCPNPIHPVSILRQTGDEQTVEERSVWRVELPRLGSVDMEISQGILSDTKKLHAHMLIKGVYLDVEQVKATQKYMICYLNSLSQMTDREKLYGRLGWHDNRTAFVTGTHVFFKDGTSKTHNASRGVKSATKDGANTKGSLEAWKKTIQFYNRPGYEGHRFFLYSAIGAPIFHMNDTGNKGVLLTASGDSGRGKTTCLKACASIWGNPDGLLINGNKDGSTVNALYDLLGTYHSLPFLWDDITERDPDELRRFLLNVSQGVGKIRMRDGSSLSERKVTWETIVLASANTDDVNRIMNSGKDVDPHLMRLIGVEFLSVDSTPEAKIEADQFIRELNQNYGHVGPLMAEILVRDYDKIAAEFVKNVALVDRLLESENASAERYWSAVVAAAYTGAKLATTMGILDFPLEEDLKWMLAHLAKQRESIKDSSATPEEIIVEYLNIHVKDTLILSTLYGGNLDNVASKPTNNLLIRHELDEKVIYISRASISAHCSDIGVPFKKLERSLINSQVLLSPAYQKVLGARTAFAKGQTRCWKLDATKLGEELTEMVRDHISQNNIIPIAEKMH